MCELTKEQLEQDSKPLDPLASTSSMFDSIFGKRLAAADAQSRKIAEAARLCREAEDDDEPWSTQP